MSLICVGSVGGIGVVPRRLNNDLLILLAGENERTRPRSEHATFLYKYGFFENVLISGSLGGFSEEKLDETEGPHTRIANYLNMRGIPAGHIFIDYRPVDTLGNFVFPYYEPLEGNPNPNELKTKVLTEEGHAKRVMQCASKVIPKDCDHRFTFSDGEYNPRITTIDGLATYLWHRGLMRVTKDIDANPEQAYNFLMRKHPFYQEGWFDKPVEERRKKVLEKTLEWNLK